jgi:hypothetical protein
METENPFADRPPPVSNVPPWRIAQPEPQVFGVPRRYDLATLMAVTLAYACLFGVLRALNAPPVTTIWTAGFLTVVGAAQALVFGGKRPREASNLAGIGFMLAVMLMVRGLPRSWEDVFIAPILFLGAIVLPGFVLGYAGGVLVAGVFLVAHYLRSGLRRLGKKRRAWLDATRGEP